MNLFGSNGAYSAGRRRTRPRPQRTLPRKPLRTGRPKSSTGIRSKWVPPNLRAYISSSDIARPSTGQGRRRQGRIPPRPAPVTILVLGASHSGKSALLRAGRTMRAATSGNKAPFRFSPTYTPTRGVVKAKGVCAPVSLPQQPYKPRSYVTPVFVDTGGDAASLEARAVECCAPFHAVVLVFDVTSRASFAALSKWMREVWTFSAKRCESVPFLVVGTKADGGTGGAARRAVRTDEGQAWASTHGMSYVETSARSGLGVARALQGAAAQAAQYETRLRDGLVPREFTKPPFQGFESARRNAQRPGTSAGTRPSAPRNPGRRARPQTSSAGRSPRSARARFTNASLFGAAPPPTWPPATARPTSPTSSTSSSCASSCSCDDHGPHGGLGVHGASLGESTDSDEEEEEGVEAGPRSRATLEAMSIAELKHEIARLNLSHRGCLDKRDLITVIEGCVDCTGATSSSDAPTDPLAQQRQRRRDEERQRERERQRLREQQKPKPKPTPSPPIPTLKETRDQVRERIVGQVKQWGTGKSISVLLNEIHHYSPNDARYLRQRDGGMRIVKAYKRALLKIHPDKHAYHPGQDDGDDDATNLQKFEKHIHALEMFKVVNSAYNAFNAASSTASSSSSSEGGHVFGGAQGTRGDAFASTTGFSDAWSSFFGGGAPGLGRTTSMPTGKVPTPPTEPKVYVFGRAPPFSRPRAQTPAGTASRSARRSNVRFVPDSGPASARAYDRTDVARDSTYWIQLERERQRRLKANEVGETW